MEEKLIPIIDFTGYCKDKYIIVLGDYEIKVENGKTYAVRKQPQYPKTYEECCKILGILNVDLCFNADYRSFDDSKEQWKRLGLMNQFYQLLICRDAYWKIAGEQMGFGKPWEPDWKSSDLKYVIKTMGDEICKPTECTINCFLAFPTEEMRDAFFENYKDLIEQCKELFRRYRL